MTTPRLSNTCTIDFWNALFLFMTKVFFCLIKQELSVIYLIAQISIALIKFFLVSNFVVGTAVRIFTFICVEQYSKLWRRRGVG